MTQQRPPTKPLPTPTSETQFYWDRCKQHELWVRRCNDCSQAYFYPRDMCPDCFSRNTEWIRSSGRGHAAHVWDRGEAAASRLGGGRAVRGGDG